MAVNQDAHRLSRPAGELPIIFSRKVLKKAWRRLCYSILGDQPQEIPNKLPALTVNFCLFSGTSCSQEQPVKAITDFGRLDSKAGRPIPTAGFLISQVHAGMRSWKRLLFFLLLNVFVSAATTVTIIYLWDQNQSSSRVGELSPMIIPGAGSPTDSGLPSSSLPGSDYQVYVVQYGDTLASIAQQVGISLDELRQINCMSSSVEIGVGQEIFIPAGSSVSAGSSVPAGSSTPSSPESTQLPSASGQGGAPSPTAPPTAAPQLEIQAVVGAGDIETEHVVLKNVGESQVSLAGWRLRNEGGSEYAFPQLNLFKDGSVNVHTRAGVDSVTDLYWGRQDAAWEPGSRVTLLDPQGHEHVVFKIP
jgi:LysM repeat protein